MTLTKTIEAVFVATNCSLVSVYKIPETACPTGSLERQKACPKNHQCSDGSMYYRTGAFVTNLLDIYVLITLCAYAQQG